jgi:hypothetical protein
VVAEAAVGVPVVAVAVPRAAAEDTAADAADLLTTVDVFITDVTIVPG